MRQSQNLARKPLPTSPNRNYRRRKKNKLEVPAAPTTKPEVNVDSAKDIRPVAPVPEVSEPDPLHARVRQVAEQIVDTVPAQDTDESDLHFARKYRDELDGDPKSSEPLAEKPAVEPPSSPEVVPEQVTELQSPPQSVTVENVPELQIEESRLPEPAEILPPTDETIQESGEEPQPPATDPAPKATEVIIPIVPEQAVEAVADLAETGDDRTLDPEPATVPTETQSQPVLPEPLDIPLHDTVENPTTTLDNLEVKQVDTISTSVPVEQAVFEDESASATEFVYEPDMPLAESTEETPEESFEMPIVDITAFQEEIATRPLEETLEELAPVLTEQAYTEGPTETFDHHEAEAVYADLENYKEEVRDALQAVVELVQDTGVEEIIEEVNQMAEQVVMVENQRITSEQATGQTAAAEAAKVTMIIEAMDPELTLRLLTLLRAIGYENPRETLQELLDSQGLEFLLQKLQELHKKVNDRPDHRANGHLRILNIMPEAVELEPDQLVSVHLARPVLGV